MFMLPGGYGIVSRMNYLYFVFMDIQNKTSDTLVNENGAHTDNELGKNSSTTPGRHIPASGDASSGMPSSNQVPKRFNNRRKKTINRQLTQIENHMEPPPGVPMNLSFPMFFILRSTTSKALAEYSPMKISDALVKVLNTTIKPPISKLHNGALLVKALTKQQSSALSNLTSLIDIPITSTPDKIRNTSKGTIFADPEKHSTTEDLCNHLNFYGYKVLDIFRFPPHKDTPNSPNPRLLLTFDTPFPPTNVEIGYVRYSVRTYIPRPTRCPKCQKFGHPKKYCRGSEDICDKCGQVFHDPCNNSPHCINCKSFHDPCNNSPCCINCKGSHPASYIKCPTYLFEKEVMEVSTLRKLGRFDAKRIVRERQPPKQQSYANVVSTPKVNTSHSSETIKKPITTLVSHQVKLNNFKKTNPNFQNTETKTNVCTLPTLVSDSVKPKKLPTIKRSLIKPKKPSSLSKSKISRKHNKSSIQINECELKNLCITSSKSEEKASYKKALETTENLLEMEELIADKPSEPSDSTTGKRTLTSPEIPCESTPKKLTVDTNPQTKQPSLDSGCSPQRDNILEEASMPSHSFNNLSLPNNNSVITENPFSVLTDLCPDKPP